jgi:hypothetical protein
VTAGKTATTEYLRSMNLLSSRRAGTSQGRKSDA